MDHEVLEEMGFRFGLYCQSNIHQVCRERNVALAGHSIKYSAADYNKYIEKAYNVVQLSYVINQIFVLKNTNAF